MKRRRLKARPRHNPPAELHTYRDPLLDHREFLRFGAFGQDCSRVRLDEEFRREVLDGKNFEAGLSVYEAEVLGEGRVRLVSPDRRRAAYHVGGSYLQDMLAGFVQSIARDKVYLVTGAVVSHEFLNFNDALDEEELIVAASLGSDGEPLLDPCSVRILRTFESDEALDLILSGSRPIGGFRLWYGRTLRSAVEEAYPEEEPEENPRRRRR